MRLLSPEDLSRLETHLHSLLRCALEGGGSELSGLRRITRGFVTQSGGKRMRPQLCWWTWRHAAGVRLENEERSALDLACVWEMFHAFLLAHDDIIDGAEVRRDRPSLHRQLAELDSNSLKFGTDLAIVAGDLLYTAAFQVLHDLEVPAEVHRELLRLFSRVARLTGQGQALDICQSHEPIDQVREQTLLREYYLKTAVYTFEGPMLSGAYLAGITPGAAEALSRYSLALGQAYQIQNDLNDLMIPAREGCDLAQGKRTPTLLWARQGMASAEVDDFDALLSEASGPGGVGAAERLRRVILDGPAPARTKRVINDFLEQSLDACNATALPQRLSAAMQSVLQGLKADYFKPMAGDMSLDAETRSASSIP